MLYLLPACLCAFASTTIAAILAGSPTTALLGGPNQVQVGIITPKPNLQPALGLRKRQGASSICGYADDDVSFWCQDTALYCAATILRNGDAYQFCSTSGEDAQAIGTTCREYGASCGGTGASEWCW